MRSLDGKVAIVTGAGGRIGRASVTAMVAAGAKVLAVDIDAASAQQTCDAAGADARPCVADVSVEADVEAMVAAATEFGGVDIMFNNAGLVGLEHGIDLPEIDVEIWDRVLAVNLRGVMLGCKHASPAMAARGGGSIVNTSSDSSLAGDVSNFAYAASKGGVNVLTRYVAASVGRQGIRCNAISPGVHLTADELARVQVNDGPGAQVYALVQEHCLLPRLGTPEDVAKTAVFLASDDAQYITGQVLQVDGGLIGHVPHLADVRQLRQREIDAAEP